MATIKHNRGFKKYKVSVSKQTVTGGEETATISAWQPRRVFAVVTSVALAISLIAPVGIVTAAPPANPAANIDQCRNGTVASPNNCEDIGGSAGWVNANAGSSNSHYQEGGSIPYRMILTGLTGNTTYTLVIGYDTKDSGKHSIDYLTTVNRANAAAVVDPCDGAGTAVANCPIPVSGSLPAGVTSYPIPAPTPNATPTSLGYSGSIDDSASQPITSFNYLSSAQKRFVIAGGTISSATVSAPADALTASSSTTTVKIVLTTGATDTTAVVAWGGHIASRADWGFSGGEAVSAGGINGSSYHGRLKGFCTGDVTPCTDGGNQDRSLSADAVLTGDLLVVKQVINDDGGHAVAADFTISVAGTNPSPASFSGSDLGTAVQLDPGSYSVTETPSANYTVSYSADCNSSIVAGQQKLCVVTNDDNPPTTGTLTLVKTVVNDNGGTAVAADFQGKIDGNNVAWGSAQTVSSGAHVASESNLAGYTAGSWGGDCDAQGNVTVGVNQSKTCTITNDDNAPVQPTLKLAKQVTNDNGGNNAPAAWTLTASGTNGFSDSGDSTTFHTVNAGEAYALSESTIANYTAGAWSCDGGSLNNNSITLSTGENVTCTITNDDNAPQLHLRKIVTNNNSGTAAATDWTLTATGTNANPTTNLSGTTPVDSGSNFKADIYALAESAGPAGYTASAWDCGNANMQDPTHVIVSFGSDITCTITNDDNAPSTGTLTVTKVVVNNNGGTAQVQDFPLFINQTSVTSGTANTLPPGNYTVSETNQTGYSGTISGDCDANGNVTLAAGENKACTITNDDQQGSLTVKKIVINDDKTGNSSPADFQIHVKFGANDVAGSPQAGSDNPGTTYNLDAGVYDVSETGPGGYAASFTGCTSTGSITVTLGANAVCTITNNDIARQQPTDIDLSIDKVVSDATPSVGDQVTYTFTVDNAGPADATGVVATDTLPAGVTYVSDNGGGAAVYDSNTRTLTWTIGNLAVNDPAVTLQVVVSIDINTKGQTIVNLATVDGNETDNNQSNNSDDASLTVNNPRGGGGGGGSTPPPGRVLGETTSIPYQAPGKVLAAELPRTGLPLQALYLFLAVVGLAAVPTFRLRKQD